METVTKQRRDTNQGNAIAWQNGTKQYNQKTTTENKQQKTKQ